MLVMLFSSLVNVFSSLQKKAASPPLLAPRICVGRMECKHNTVLRGACTPWACLQQHAAGRHLSRLALSLARSPRKPAPRLSRERKIERSSLRAQPSRFVCVIIKTRGLSNKKGRGWGSAGVARRSAREHFLMVLVLGGVSKLCVSMQSKLPRCKAAHAQTKNPIRSSLTSGGPARWCPAPGPPSRSRAARRPSPTGRTGRWRRRTRWWPGRRHRPHPTCPV